MSFELPAIPFTDAAYLFSVLATAILLGPLLAKWLRLPEVVTVVLVGFAVGPTGLGLVERAGVVAGLGSAGLLYLMLLAGLELDLDDFVEHRRDAIGFGVMTFLAPMLLGYVVSLGLGYGQVASVLLASCWASHTLVTYPSFQRVGTVGNRAVATSVGATIITDTAALLVLAVVARAWLGELTVVFWLTLLPSLAVVTAGVLFGLPRVARRFFAGPGQQRSLRFVFVLVALFTSAAMFDVIGIEPIVGAFLVGLALNRSVPNHGQLMDRIHFIGSTLFIPFFLLATGMLIDVGVLLETRTLVIGAGFTAAALVGKWLAAELAGRALGYERAEVTAMFALSSAQAALTLAAIVVGMEIGLIDEVTVNAVMMVILVTCLAAALAAGRAAPRLPLAERERELGAVVVVPVANPATAPRLMRLASAFARTCGGLIVPLRVTTSEAGRAALATARALDAQMATVAQSAGAEASSVLRVDRSPELGIAHTVVEQQASVLVMGWKGVTANPGAAFGEVIDAILDMTYVPTVLYREGENPVERIVLVADASTTTPGGLAGLRLAMETVSVVSRMESSQIMVVTNDEEGVVTAMAPPGADVVVDRRRRSALVAEYVDGTDLVVLPCLSNRGQLRSIARRVLPEVPAGASAILCLDNSAADPRQLHEAESTDPPG